MTKIPDLPINEKMAPSVLVPKGSTPSGFTSLPEKPTVPAGQIQGMDMTNPAVAAAYATTMAVMGALGIKPSPTADTSPLPVTNSKGEIIDVKDLPPKRGKATMSRELSPGEKIYEPSSTVPVALG